MVWQRRIEINDPARDILPHRWVQAQVGCIIVKDEVHVACSEFRVATFTGDLKYEAFPKKKAVQRITPHGLSDLNKTV